MKKLLLISLLLLSTFAYGDSEKSALAERLYLALNTQAQIDALAANMQSMMAKEIGSIDIPEEAKPFVEKKYSEIISVIFETFKSEKTKNEYIQSYGQVYTKEELLQVVTFFESPAGKAYIDKGPELQKVQLAIAQKQIAEANPKVLKIAEEIKGKLSSYE